MVGLSKKYAVAYTPPTGKIRIEKTAAQNFAHGVWTKVQLDKVVYDVESEWDAVNYRYKAKKAGYYLVILRLGFTPVAVNEILFQTVVRNITTWFDADFTVANDRDVVDIGAACSHCTCAGMVYLDGVDDYIEAWAQFTAVDGNPTAISLTHGEVYFVVVQLA